MEFNLAEKLAIVKAIDNIILADKIIANGEMVYLGQLMKTLDFNSSHVEEARKFNINQSHAILEKMSDPKKHSLAIILHEMAYADGDLVKEEMKVLLDIFGRIGIKIDDSGPGIKVFDISDTYFKSSRQIYIDTETGERNVLNEKKAVKIEPHIEGKKGYTVTTFKINSLIPFWGNKVEIPSIQMDLEEPAKSKTTLRGYNDGNIQNPDENYHLLISHPGNEIEKIILKNRKENKVIEFLE